MEHPKSLTLLLLVLLVTFFSLASIRYCFASSPILTVISGVGGTTNPSSGTYTVWDVSSNWNISPDWTIMGSSVVTISATSQSGYAFDHWLVNGSSAGSTNPLTFTMTGSTTVQPIFAHTVFPPPVLFLLTVIVKNQTIPLLGVDVSIGSSHATTDISGTATFTLAAGTYSVSIDYQGITQRQTVTLTTNQQLSFDLFGSSPLLSKLELYAPAIAVAVILVIAVGTVLLIRRRK